MLGKDILRIALYGVGISSLAALIYLAGPFLAFGDWRPLENYIIRDILVVLLLAAAAGFGGFHFWRRKKRSEQIAEGIAAEGDKQESDGVVLKEQHEGCACDPEARQAAAKAIISTICLGMC